MFIYFRLILCFLNPFIRLERYYNFTTMIGADEIEVRRNRRSQKLYSIKITKSIITKSMKYPTFRVSGHKEWVFKPRFK